ncbi:MAG TPA: cupin domain-containing protein [Gemmatimonadaceae bacterium]
MNSYPYMIENGAGEQLTFTRRISDADGDRVEGTARVAPGAGPPMHVHYLQDEVFTVVRGRIGFQRLGMGPEYATQGSTIVFPAGEPHRFWNAGDEDLHCDAYIRPAGNAEFFLAALFASQRSNGGRHPGLFDVAYLTRRYRREYALLGIPRLVQRFAFPILVMVGTILGRYAKYTDAPEPLRG